MESKYTIFLDIDGDSDMKPHMDKLLKTKNDYGFTYVEAYKLLQMMEIEYWNQKATEKQLSAAGDVNTVNQELCQRLQAL